MNEREILIKAIRKYGDVVQEREAIKECSALIQDICHKQMGIDHNIEEEIASVEIMLEQLKIINHCHEKVQKFRELKIRKLYQKAFNIKEV